MSARECCYCATTERELRPYGPGGAWVCVPCAFATPERKEQTKRAFAGQLDAAAAISDIGSSILTSTGPDALMATDAAELERIAVRIEPIAGRVGGTEGAPQ